MSNYGHLSRQLIAVRDRGVPAGSMFTIGVLESIIPEINRLERIVSALESIGVNLDESDIEALEGIARDPHSSIREQVKESVNDSTQEWLIESREFEQEQATEHLAAAGFVLNDDDGETWTRGNEAVKIELTNGRESRYKWELARCANPFDLADSGVSGEFHRLLKLIAPRRLHMANKAGHFDICKQMALDNMDIQIAPLDNVTDLKKVRAGTNVTIGVAGDMVAAIGLEHKYIGGLLLINRDQYFATKAKLEAVTDTTDAEVKS